jgi:hypothetical protein
VAGIAGSAVLAPLAARSGRRRLLLLGTASAMGVASVTVAVVHALPVVTVVLAVEGLLLLAGLPVCLEWSQLRAGPALAGTAASVLFLAGNLGGVVLVLVVQALIGHPTAALLALGAAALPALALALMLPAGPEPSVPARRSAGADVP